MKDLKFPEREEIDYLEEAVEFNQNEKSYWEDMKKRRDAKIDKEDLQGEINFYLQELTATKGKFGKRIAVERRLKYMIGHAHEWMGTHSMEGHEPLERAEMFEKAILWYQSADESVGFYTDYSLRQAESCFGAASFRRAAGLEDQVTEAFFKRGDDLIKCFLSEIIGSNNEVTFVDKDIFEHLKKEADKKIDSAATAYLFEDHSKDHMLN